MVNTSTEFDYDAFPMTGAISTISAPLPPSNDWEPDIALPIANLANDPLTATFSDLDLAPARDEILARIEIDVDDEYWTN